MTASNPSFHKFSELPTELRLQIWALSIPTRIVPLTCTKGIRAPNKRFAQHFDASVPTPPLLLCNRESRRVALTTYAFHFRTAARPLGIPVSFTHDKFSLPDNTISYIDAGDRALIQHLALVVRDYAYFSLNFEFLREMGALRELELRVSGPVRNTWVNGPDFGAALFRDFRLEALDWVDWVVPAVVRVVRGETGEVVWVAGGREGLRLEEVS